MRKAGASLFIRKDANRWARKSRESQIMVIQLYRRLDSWEALKIKDPLEDDVIKVFVFSKMTSRRVTRKFQ